MRAYCYTKEEVETALAGIAPTWMDCPSTLERVSDPAQAHAFFVPLQVGHLEIRHPQRINGVMPTLARLPHWGKHEKSHFFFMHSDEDAPVGTAAIVFRWSVNKRNKDPRTITMPAPVEDLGYMVDTDYEELPFHICFVGYEDDPQGIRKRCIQSLNGCSSLNCYISPTDKHYGQYEGTYKGEKRRGQFLLGIERSRLTLAPRGAGQHSYRPIEAASAGRVSVIIADDWQLPFHDLVTWGLCAFLIPESQAATICQRILRLNEEYRPGTLAKMAQRGRQYWQDYLDPSKWDEVVLHYLKEML